ncbi:MAG: nitroreductase family protein [Erysipelotrichia bacterium]|nr:nitroreductase family protein [Erysipelotrichia bacterium]
MSIKKSLSSRRSYYDINRQMPISNEQIVSTVKELTELVPDAFNMKSSRILTVLSDKQDQFWDLVYDVFGGKVSHEKLDGFKAGAGTILYFYDNAIVEEMQKQFPRYAENFPGWALQSSGMLQISIWSALRELGVGASLQHYNPVIDEAVHRLYDLPESWKLIAEMPYGGIGSEPDPKELEDISKRVRIA